MRQKKKTHTNFGSKSQWLRWLYSGLSPCINLQHKFDIFILYTHSTLYYIIICWWCWCSTPAATISYLVIFLPWTWTSFVDDFACEQRILTGIHLRIFWLLGKSLKSKGFWKKNETKFRVKIYWFYANTLCVCVWSSNILVRLPRSHTSVICCVHKVKLVYETKYLANGVESECV